jgi:hydrogenase maturation protease
MSAPRSTGARRVPVFLCGAATRGDDGVALAVEAALRDDERALVDVVAAGALEAEHLLALAPDQPCIVVDAVAGPAPGTLVELALPALAAGVAGSPRFAAATSSHALTIPATLALAAVLRGGPVQGTFVGVGIADCRVGAPMTPAVAAAVPALARAIGHAARRLAATEAATC